MSSRDGARYLGRTLRTLALVLAPALVLGGCGKKGPPLPPLRFVPAPTQDLSVAQRDDQILLRFTYPKTTAAGAVLEGVTEIDVYELDRPAPPPAPPAPAATTGTPATPATGTTATTTTTPAAGTTAGTTTPSPAPGTAAAKPAAPAAPGAPPKPGTPATPAVGAPSVPPPPANLPGNFPPIDARELPASAKVKLKLQGADVTAAVLGDKVVISLPVGELPPASAAPAAGSTGTTTAAGTAGKTSTAPASGTAAGKTGFTAGTAATPATTELVRYFAVRLKGPKGDPSAFSNQAAILPKTPPPPPGDLHLTPKADGIELAWGAPAGTDAAGVVAATGGKVLGFNIYRRDATAKAFGAPLRAAFFDTRTVVDQTARFGDSYIYAVTSIADPNPLRESVIRGEVEVKYVDRFPPPVPGDVVALAEAGKVRVVWRASAAPDLAGYLVYRRAGARGNFQKLTAQPVAEVQYLDGTVSVGTTYTYRVTAIDQSGNESAPGEAQTKAQ